MAAVFQETPALFLKLKIMQYPTGPYPTREIVKEDTKGLYTVIINRHGYATGIIRDIHKKEFKPYPVLGDGKEITICNG